MVGKVWEDLDPTQFQKLVEEGIPCVRNMGVKVVEMKPRRVVLKMPLAGNESHLGTMYAGVLFTLGEIPGGALHLTTFDVTKYVPVVKHMEISFKKLATTDISVTVELSQEEVDRINQEAAEKGKSEFVLKSELKDDNGVVVAETVGTYQIRKF